MNEICILAAPRSGTNHMCALWRGFRNHASFAEIFHSNSAHGCRRYLADLNAAFGIAAKDIDDPVLTARMQDDPVLGIETLKAACARKGFGSISYKIFPPHLKPARLDTFLNRDGVTVVFVKRLLIDCYISTRKAQALETWTKAETTGRQVTLDYGEFEKWATARRRWFRRAEKLLTESGRPFRVITYEADINCSPEQHLAAAGEVLADLGLDMPLSDAGPKSGHTKQDASQNYHDKVANWREFCREARSRGEIERLWDYP